MLTHLSKHDRNRKTRAKVPELPVLANRQVNDSVVQKITKSRTFFTTSLLSNTEIFKERIQDIFHTDVSCHSTNGLGSIS
jgi:hypothetical protein